MTGLEDRMISLVWHVVVSCGPRRHAEAIAWRILHENFPAAEVGDLSGRALRGRLVHALRVEFGVRAEVSVDEARVRDELAIRRSRAVHGAGRSVEDQR